MNINELTKTVCSSDVSAIEFLISIGLLLNNICQVCEREMTRLKDSNFKTGFIYINKRI